MTSNPVRRTTLLLAIVLGVVTCATLKRQKRNGWSKSWGPLVPHKTFPADCGLCHVPDRWDVLKEEFGFDHAKKTGVALEGAHATAACLRCHNDFGPVTVYTDRTFSFITKSPPAAVLLRQAAGIAKGSGTPNTETVGTVTEEQVQEIARAKMEDLNATDLAGACKIIEGTARSMGVKVGVVDEEPQEEKEAE